MKRKLAEGIVKARFFLMAFVLLLTIPAAMAISKSVISLVPVTEVDTVLLMRMCLDLVVLRKHFRKSRQFTSRQT